MSWPLLIFALVGHFLPSGRQNPRKGELSKASHWRKVFWTFCTCFKISILNLVYAFSRQHHTLSLITFRSLWPTLQPIMGQSHFFSFMVSKNIKSLYIWYTHLYIKCLDPYWFFFMVGHFLALGWPQTLGKGILAQLPVSGKFSELFVYFLLRYKLTTWYIQPVGGKTHWVWVSLQ